MSKVTPSIIHHEKALPSSFNKHTEEESSAVFCYENAVPPFIEAELERLYQNVFSSLAHFKAYGGLPPDTCTYVARNDKEVTAIFLFRQVKGTVIVLNEGMQIDAKAVDDFARYVFSTWPQVNVIVFQAVRARFTRSEWPSQRCECTAQVTMPLPATEEVYLSSLSKNMRRNIRRYLKRLEQDFPSFRFDVYGPGDVDRSKLQAIFDLSRSRIMGLNRAFMLDDEAEKIFDLAKLSGLVGVATIDGKVCGGMIGFCTGGIYFAKVLGHHPAYKDYSLGILCCYLMIRACIDRGMQEFNFMWNEYPYKAALGGGRLGLHRVVLYRSATQVLLHGDFAAKVALHGWRFRLASLLEKEGMEEGLSPAEKMALRALLWLRNRKHALSTRSLPPAQRAKEGEKER